jgi:flagellar protein FliO/FliZ
MQALTFFFAFVAVLALIGLAAWLVRRFASNRLGTNPNRGRMPRLAVIDAAAVDGRRRLVLVRRDNIEHLLMIGGPTDIVIESNIVRAAHAREQLPPRPNLSSVEPPAPPRIAPLPDAQAWPDKQPAWPDNDGAKPDVFELPEQSISEVPTRPMRQAFPDEGRRPSPNPAERRGDFRAEVPERRESMPGFPPEPIARPEPRPEPRQDQRHELRGEPRMEQLRGEPRLERPERLMPRPDMPRPDTSRSEMPRPDISRPEMARPDLQRPDLQRPDMPRPEMPRPDISRDIPREMPRGEPVREQMMPRQLRSSEQLRQADPVKAPPMRAPERAVAPPPPPPPPPPVSLSPVPPQQNAEANLAEMAQRLEAALRRPPIAPGEPPAEASEPPPLRSAARGDPLAGGSAPAPKTNFENLEDEMASLLGRPKSSS